MTNETEALNFLKFYIVFSYIYIGSRLINNSYREILEEGDIFGLLGSYDIIKSCDYENFIENVDDIESLDDEIDYENFIEEVDD